MSGEVRVAFFFARNFSSLCEKDARFLHGDIYFSDIQEFYELTLLDDTKSVQEKTAETIRIANKWEANDGPIAATYTNDVSTLNPSNLMEIYLKYANRRFSIRIFAFPTVRFTSLSNYFVYFYSFLLPATSSFNPFITKWPSQIKAV